MKSCYDWDKNEIDFKLPGMKYKYALKFKGRKTIVSGKSATGKTMLCNTLKEILDYQGTAAKDYDASNVFVLNTDNKDRLREQSKKLIIIDRGELQIDDEIKDFINRDRKNRYLLFLRQPKGINLSPNYFADMEQQKGAIVLSYRYNEQGWN
ncbi:hypothetical protein SAMN04487884_12711 [Butyrivibrio fibrisolvens]|uniref:Uncharacterized protein n=1 Tax=Butyrivibrio fibrisolvens TaxID=831 RepID=A0A1H9W4G5_BUTFI|nr:hypothetical protein [Butyrivibrio fibrisolvens]SES28768.1 hypothetical protein SAMN04487884_12711 [Butyrivibrio fibrisolvens]